MREGVNLEAQLDAYEASSSLGDGAAGKRWHRAWPIYAAAAGSSLAMTTAAGAAIIYSGPNQNVSASINGLGSSQATAPVKIGGPGHSFNLSVRHGFSSIGGEAFQFGTG